MSGDEHICPDPDCWHRRVYVAGDGMVLVPLAGPGPLAEVLPEALRRLAAAKRPAAVVEVPPPPAGVAFLLWSGKHKAWWRPNAAGYTTVIDEAGRYDEAEALRYVRDSAMCGQLAEVTSMVAAPDNWTRTEPSP